MITPQTESPEIAQELGIGKLWLKREDLHPLGSHKGRSIPVMIDMKVAQGARDFVISSSGNAALAAVRHIKKRLAEGDKLTLTVLVGRNINKEKLERLREEVTQVTQVTESTGNTQNTENTREEERIKIESAPRPLQALFSMIKSDGKASLRQSTDPEALIGYRALAAEIAATPDLEAVFIGTSSGTTAQALADYFIEHSATIGTKFPQVHIVQTTGTSPIASAFASEEAEGSGPDSETHSLADAIIDKVAHRGPSLEASIRKTAGSGWIARNDDILAAQKLLRDKAGIETTPNGALGLAGLLRALKSGAKAPQFPGAVVCVITGK